MYNNRRSDGKRSENEENRVTHMKKLIKLHIFDLVMLIAGETISMLLALYINNNFSILPPKYVMGILFLVWPLAGFTLRFCYWNKRREHLTEEELERWSTKAFFGTMWCELFFVIIGAAIILSS